MIVYMAHPVAPYDGRTVADNLASAKLWLRWCHMHLPAWTVIAPWIVECEIHDENDLDQRKAGIARDLVVVRACDAVLLVGQRLTSGMREEAATMARHGAVYSLIYAARASGAPPIGAMTPIRIDANIPGPGLWHEEIA